MPPRQTIILALSILACSSAMAQPPIRVGVLLSIYGNQHTEAEQALRGIEVAHEMSRDEGKRRIELVKASSVIGPSDSAVATLRLISRDSCGIIIAGVAPSVASSAYYTARGYSAQVLSPAANGLLVEGDRRKLSLELFVNKAEARLGARMARKELGLESAGLCVDSSEESSIGLANEFKKEFERLGGKVVITRSLKNGWPGLGSIVEDFRQSGARIIYAPLFSLQCAHLAIARKALKLEAPILTTQAAAHSGLINEAGPAAEGVMATTSFESGYELTEQGLKFRDEYERAFGQWPDMWAILSAEAYFRIVGAIETVGSSDLQLIQAALNESPQKGAGNSNLVKTPENRVAQGLVIVSKGRFAPMTKDKLKRPMESAGALALQQVRARHLTHYTSSRN